MALLFTLLVVPCALADGPPTLTVLGPDPTTGILTLHAESSGCGRMAVSIDGLQVHNQFCSTSPCIINYLVHTECMGVETHTA